MYSKRKGTSACVHFVEGWMTGLNHCLRMATLSRFVTSTSSLALMFRFKQRSFLGLFALGGRGKGSYSGCFVGPWGGLYSLYTRRVLMYLPICPLAWTNPDGFLGWGKTVLLDTCVCKLTILASKVMKCISNNRSWRVGLFRGILGANKPFFFFFFPEEPTH